MGTRAQCPRCDALATVQQPGHARCHRCGCGFSVPPDPALGIDPAPDVDLDDAPVSTPGATALRLGIAAVCCTGLLVAGVWVAVVVGVRADQEPPAPASRARSPAPLTPPAWAVADARQSRDDEREQELRRLRARELELEASVRALRDKDKSAETELAAGRDRLRRSESRLAEARERQRELEDRCELAESMVKVQQTTIGTQKKELLLLRQKLTAASRQPESQPEPAKEPAGEDTDPRLRAALIAVVQKMKRGSDPRAWSKLELYERELIDEVLYKFALSRYQHGNGLTMLSEKEVVLMKRAGFSGYVRMEESRRRPEDRQ